MLLEFKETIINPIDQGYKAVCNFMDFNKIDIRVFHEIFYIKTETSGSLKSVIKLVQILPSSKRTQYVEITSSK